MRREECARLAKAENVGSYENPFRVKNDPARNTLGIRSVTRRMGKGRGRKKRTAAEIEKSFQPSARTRGEGPENGCSCETQKGSRGFSSQKGP